METVVEINGRRAIVVAEDPQVSASSSSASAATTLKAAKQKRSVAGAYHCSLCDAYFWDSAAVATHRASRRHRENTGELARERMKYKPDAEVTVDDVMELVERKKHKEGGGPSSSAVSLSEILFPHVNIKRPREDD